MKLFYNFFLTNFYLFCLPSFLCRAFGVISGVLPNLLGMQTGTFMGFGFRKKSVSHLLISGPHKRKPAIGKKLYWNTKLYCMYNIYSNVNIDYIFFIYKVVLKLKLKKLVICFMQLMKKALLLCLKRTILNKYLLVCNFLKELLWYDYKV